MKFVFNHKPEAKKRPRFGAKGKVYDPQKNKSLSFKWDAAHQMRLQGAEMALESPISVTMRIHVPMPNSWPQKRKKEALGTFVTSKPDVDNFCKEYLDVLNGIAYKDDAQVVQLSVEKIWDYHGKVEISVVPSCTSLMDEIEMIAQFAVQYHAALDEIYWWAKDTKIRSSDKKTHDLMDFLAKKCLDSGLDEIY